MSACEQFILTNANPNQVVVSALIGEHRIPVVIANAPRSPKHWMVEERTPRPQIGGMTPVDDEHWQPVDRVALNLFRREYGFRGHLQTVAEHWTESENIWLEVVRRDATLSAIGLMNDPVAYRSMVELNMALTAHIGQMAQSRQWADETYAMALQEGLPHALTFIEAQRRATAYQNASNREFRITNVVTGEIWHHSMLAPKHTP